MNETIRGMTVKKSAFEVLDYFEIRECVDFVTKLLGLSETAFKGVTVRSLENNRTVMGQYNPKNRTITLYRSTNIHSKLLRKSILVHELMHALQHNPSFYCFNVTNADFADIDARQVRMSKGKYFSNPIELEAFTTQYHYLKQHGMEVLADYWTKQYRKLGIDLHSLSESIYGR